MSVGELELWIGMNYTGVSMYISKYCNGSSEIYMYKLQ